MVLTCPAVFYQSRDKLPFWENGTGKREAWQNGWHGYDNELMEMRGIFLAYGPGTMPPSPSPPGEQVGLPQLGVTVLARTVAPWASHSSHGPMAPAPAPLQPLAHQDLGGTQRLHPKIINRYRDFLILVGTGKVSISISIL